MSRTVFISAGINLWYSTGAKRFQRTLREVGWTDDIKIFVDEWPNNKFPRDSVYTIKAACFDWAIREGYTTIIWGDASMHAVRNPQPLVDIINTKGYWLGQSGYNAAQTCSDACLNYFGVTRDWAEKIHDCASGLFGVNLDFPIQRSFIEGFVQAGKDGAFHGSRKHANQSSDPRFLFHRQDQSAATILAGKHGMPLDEFIKIGAFKWDKDSGQIFRCEGM